MRGVLATMTALVRRDDVSHVAVAFDPSMGSVEDKSSAEALIKAQYLLAADVVRALGLVVWPMIRYQADDALATGAARYKRDPRVRQVVVCTTDRDLLQCVEGGRVVLLDRVRRVVTDEAAVRERFGVAPASIPDWHALVGDPSDGLPGIPGWGPKTAATVLGRYGHIEAVPPSAADWDVVVRGAEGLSAVLEARRREALLMRDLSILRSDVPLRDEVDDLAWQGARRDELEAMAAAIGAEEQLTRVPRWRTADL